MKTLSNIIAAIAVSTAAAQGASISCGPSVTFSGGAGSSVFTCPGYSGPTLTGALLIFSGSITSGSTTGSQVQFTFTASQPPGVTWASTTTLVSVDVASGTSTPVFPVFDAAVNGVTNANFASAFNVSINTVVIPGAGGPTSAGPSVSGVGSATLGVSVNYLTAAPEPESLMLAAMGLTAILARRRARSRY